MGYIYVELFNQSLSFQVKDVNFLDGIDWIPKKKEKDFSLVDLSWFEVRITFIHILSSE